MNQEWLDVFGGKFVANPTTGCWIWAGGVTGSGYGAVQYAGATQSVHRVSYKLWYGAIHDGLLICHHCDVRPCIRPQHLFQGTQADNLRDASMKGRTATGERHNSHRYPEQRPYGDRNGSRKHPERVPRGDKHGSRLHPELCPRGERNGSAKLTGNSVVAIRTSYALGARQADLARQYGVSRSTMSAIVRRLIWKHIA